MRIKIIILLLCCAAFARAQNTVKFGGGAADTARNYGNLRSDGAARFPLYSNNDTTLFLSFDSRGMLVLRRGAGGPGTTYTQGYGITISGGMIRVDTIPMASKTWVTSTVNNAIGAYVPSPLWSNILSKPSSFPPSAHTHTLSDITQSGATNGQVPKWVNGVGWVPSTDNTGGSGTPDSSVFVTTSRLRDSMARILGYWNVEAFGAVPIDPNNPNAAPASDSAINACILYAYANDPTGSPVIYFPGMYRANSDPSRLINGVQHYCQFYIPFTPYNQTTVFKKITFVGKSAGNFDGTPVASGIYSGSGIYCSRVETTQRGASVFGYEKSTFSGTYEAVNYTPAEFTNFTVIVKTNNGSTQLTNYMSGIDADGLDHFVSDKLRIRSSSTPDDQTAPAAGSFGLRMPTLNNHALLKNTVVYINGFDKGLILGEHSHTDMAIIFYCGTGVVSRRSYPSDISDLSIEGCTINVEAQDYSQLDIGTCQFEDFNSGWKNNTYDFYTSGNPTLAHITIGQQVTHLYGGYSIAPKKSSVDMDVKITSDEGGRYQIPANHWTTSNRPATMLGQYGWGLNTENNTLDYWTQGGWTSIAGNSGGGGSTVTTYNYVLVDSFNRANNSSSIGNLVKPASAWNVESGTWGITSNTAYCPSQASSGSTRTEYVNKDAGVSDYTIEVDLKHTATLVNSAVTFRHQDAANHLHVGFSDGGVQLYTVIGGTFTQIANYSYSTGSRTVGAFNHYKIIASGTSVTVYENGVLIITATTSAFQMQTQAGLGAVSGSGFGVGSVFDNFVLYTTSTSAGSLDSVDAYVITAGGQSNNLGVGPSDSLYISPLNQIPDSLTAANLFERVLIYDRYTNTLEPFHIGVNNQASSDGRYTYTGAAVGTRTFGPELGIAYRFISQVVGNSKLVIIKESRDGQAINTFRKSNANGWYDSMLTRSRRVDSLLPLYGLKLLPNQRHFLWTQGEAEGSQTQGYYEAQLDSFVNELTADGVITGRRVIGNVSTTSTQYGAGPDAAKVHWVATHSNAYLIYYPLGTEYFNSDQVHLNHKGQMQYGYDAFWRVFATNRLAIPGTTIVTGGGVGGSSSGFPTSGNVAYWKLDETSGNFNSTVGSYPLTRQNGVATSTGKIMNAADFTASSTQYLLGGTGSSFSITSSGFTIAGWVNVTSGGLIQNILAKAGSTSSLEYGLYADNAGGLLHCYYSTNGSATVGSGAADFVTPLSIGSWQFFALVFDGSSQLKLSVNAGTAATSSVSSIYNGSGAFMIGQNLALPTYPMNGKIDEVGVWNRALTNAELTTLYNAGAGLTHP